MKKLLHIGCGHNSIANTTAVFNSGEWTEIRFDIDPSVSPDVTGTMTDMANVNSDSVDAIFSSHNIEHLYPHEVPIALAEFMRVLKEDGFIVITCPDLKSVSELVAQDKLTDTAYVSAAGPIAPIDIIYGYRTYMSQGNLYMAHRCGFTEKVLISTLQAAGFQSIASLCRATKFDLWAIASKKPKGEIEMRELAASHFPN